MSCFLLNFDCLCGFAPLRTLRNPVWRQLTAAPGAFRGSLFFGVSNLRQIRLRLALRLGGAKLRQRIDRRLAVAGADDRAMAFIRGRGRIERLAYWSPRRAEASEHEIVLNRQFKPRAGKLALNRQDGGESPSIGQPFSLQFRPGPPTRIEQALDCICEIHARSFWPIPRTIRPDNGKC